MIRRFATVFISVFLTLAVIISAWADLSPRQKLDVLGEAQQAYDHGIGVLRSDPVQARSDFKLASERFQLLVDCGARNGQLFYNLANTYLQMGDLGRAILNYRQAERFIPGDGQVQSNLQYARSLCLTQIAPSGKTRLLDAILGWHQRIPLSWRFLVFASINVTLWLLLAVPAMKQHRTQSVLRLTTLFILVCWVALGASVGAQALGLGEESFGVLVENEVIARKGNGSGFEPAFQQSLNAGVEFTLLERRGDWLNIQLANGETVWVESRSAVVAQ